MDTPDCDCGDCGGDCCFCCIPVGSGKNDDGCFGLIAAIVVIFILIVLVCRTCSSNHETSPKRNWMGKVERQIAEYKIIAIQKEHRIGTNFNTVLENTETKERIIVKGKLGEVNEIIKYNP